MRRRALIGLAAAAVISCIWLMHEHDRERPVQVHATTMDVLWNDVTATAATHYCDYVDDDSRLVWRPCSREDAMRVKAELN